VLLKQQYGGENLEKVRYVCLRFQIDGQGVVVGSFDQPLKAFKQAMVERFRSTQSIEDL